MGILKNKNGIAYIYVCIITLFIAALLSVVVLYMGLISQVQIQKRNIQKKLDSYMAEYATEAFNAIKQGESYEVHIDYYELQQGVFPTFGFTSPNMSEYHYANGNCTITRPVITVLRGNGFGLTARYNAIFPIRWNGKAFSSLTIPVTVSSYFKFK